MVNFPTQIPDCGSDSPALLDLFLTLIFVLKWFSLDWEIWIMLLSVSIDVPSNSQQDVPYHYIAYDYSRTDWTFFVIFGEIFYGRISLNSVASVAASEFCKWVQVEIDVYIPNYQVKPHSFPWFSTVCAAAIVHRNHFFICINRINLLNLKFRQASNCCKKASWSCQVPKLAYANITKDSITPQKLGYPTFCELPMVFSTKVNLLHLVYSMPQRCCLLHLIKQNFLLKTFLRTLIFMIQASLCLFSLWELIWNCIIFLKLPRWLIRS